jgi:hypothetical protein
MASDCSEIYPTWNRTKLFVVLLLSVAGALGMAPVIAADEAKTVKPPEVRATIQKDPYGATVFEVTNPNDVAIPYIGYTSDSFDGGLPQGEIAPLYHVELKTADGWKKHEMGWCGTGRGHVTLAPKSTVRFGVHLPAGEWTAMRVGPSWSDPASPPAGVWPVVWSREVRRGDTAGQ